MRIKYIIVCLVAFTSLAKAQYQNYELKDPQTTTASYIGRDFVRLMPGYTFTAGTSKVMNAKVSSGLTSAEATTFLGVANPAGVSPDVVTSIDKTKAVGQIPISSSVSASGAKCYNVPIDIIPGRQGFQPNISLSYNSQAGNGLVGMGWSISGLSSIERVNKNMYMDGLIEIPNFDSYDAFELDGIRLIEMSRSISKISYETQQTNIKVEAYFSTTDAGGHTTAYTTDISYFKVYYPNGNIAYFNYVGHGNIAFKNVSYPITDITDVNGNQISFTYSSDNIDINGGTNNEIFYIDEINYGAVKNKSSNFAKIKFTFDPAARPDIISSLISTKSCIIRKRLSKIESYVNQNILRSYQLTYSNNDPRVLNNLNDVSRLTQLDCSAGTETLNPLKFYYGEKMTPSVISKTATHANSNFELRPEYVSRVNAVRGKFIANSQSDAFFVFPQKSVYKKETTGEYSIEYPNNELIQVYLNPDDDTKLPMTITSGDGFEDAFAVDVDGNGQDEIIKVNMKFDDYLGDDYECLTFNVYGINSNQQLQLKNSYDYRLNGLAYVGENYSVTPWKFYTGNFSGQGKTEILAISRNNTVRDNALLIEVDEGARNLFTSINLMDSPSDIIYPMDIDGDGQTEILCVREAETELYKFKSGSGFTSLGTWSELKQTDFTEINARQIMFADLNGDGNMDIIRSPKPNDITYIPQMPKPAPSWFSNTDVWENWMHCPKCGYLLKRAIKGESDIPKHIAVVNNRIMDYYPGNAPGNVTTYPKYISNDRFQYLCPGCENTWEADAYEYDGLHCWVCNGPLSMEYIFWGDLRCLSHGKIESYSWSYPVPPKEVINVYKDWIYQYTNGRSIVKTETIEGIERKNDHKYSIHEINGNDTPDLIVQCRTNTSFSTSIYPFDINRRSFQAYYLSYNDVPYGYEYIDYDLNSSHTYSTLLALGSNQVIQCKFPYNHTRSSMISIMKNSLGLIEKNDYNQLTIGTNYTMGNSAIFPYTDFSGAFWVTTRTSSMYDKKIIDGGSYSYARAIMHNQGLGLCGFSEVKSTDLMTNKTTTTNYDPYKLGSLIGQTSDVEESNIEYDFSVATNKKMSLLVTKKTVTDKLRGNTIIKTYPLEDYDVYGNPKKIVTNYGSGKSTNQLITYKNVITGFNYNLIGLPLTVNNERVANGKTYTQKDEFEYYATNNRLHYAKKYIGTNLLTNTEYKYDANYGNVTDQIVNNVATNDFLTTSYGYDTDNCMLKTQTNPQGIVTTYVNDLDKRRIDEVHDYLNNSVVYGYNNWGGLKSQTSKYSTGVAFKSSDIKLEWSSVLDPKLVIQATTTTSGQPTVTTYTDAFGRELRKSIVGFDGTIVIADKELDNFGRLKKSSTPYKSTETPLWTEYSYDQYNRPERVLQHNGSITSYAYDQNIVSENTNGLVSTKTYDVLGQLTNSSIDGSEVINIYRPDGQLEKVTANGVETNFEYDDPYNRQTKLIDPSAGTIQTVYDDATHKITQTWNSGKSISISTNMYGQVESKTTPDFTTTYGFDTYHRPTGSSSTNGTSKAIEYDTYGRLWKMNETINGKSYQEVYEYDNGKISNIRHNTGSTTNLTNLATVVYKYNNYGYLYRLEDANQNQLWEINSVNSLGLETDVLLGNGLSTTKAYTPEGLCTNVNTSKTGLVIQNMNYDFNRINGTLNSRTDLTRAGLTEVFSYDGMYRLKTYGTKVIDYNPNGNILTKSDVGTASVFNYVESGKPYTLSRITNATTPDLSSQLNVDYTIMSRPTTISKPDGLSTAFTYNDDYDRCIMQTKQGTTETLNKYYFAGGKYEIETVGGIEKQRLYLDGSPYSASAMLEKSGSDAAQLYYLHRDYLGSITQITDNSANLVAEYSYDAWGRMRNPLNWQVYAQGSQPAMPYGGRGYTGHEQLNGFGIINMNARLYDPLLGRFLAPDPLVSTPEMPNAYNRYIYASNNPLMYVDINGEDGDIPGGGLYYRPPGSYPSGGGSSTPYNNPPPYNRPPWWFIPGYAFPGNQNNSGAGYTGGNQNSSNSGYSAGYGGGFGGGYGGGYNGTATGAAIIAFVQYLLNPNSGSARFRPGYVGPATPYFASSTSAKPISLPKPVGSGASTVYTGGGSNKTNGNRSSNRNVEVLIWDQNAGKDVGHTAIRMDNEIYGYYPTDENEDGQYSFGELIKSKGTMSHLNLTDFNRHYSGDRISAFRLQTTNIQYNNLKKSLNDVEQHPGYYSLFGRNCTSIAMECLTNSGYNIGLKHMGQNESRLVTPNSFGFILKWNYNQRTLVNKYYRIILK